VSNDLPVPVPDIDDAEWWDSLQKGDLMVAECDSCGGRWVRALPTCPFCGGQMVGMAKSNGRGTVYSWVVVHRALDPAFAEAVPYTVLVVDLDGGGRIEGRLVGIDQVDAGMHVRFVPYRSAGWTLVGFSKATD
jgi:uncharacterized protein